MIPEPDNRAPCLSVVVTTRNDDHGGDPLKRLQAFVNTFDAHCRRTGLDAEIIVVEWNPPVDRPRLESLLRLPERHVCVYRFIQVPPELHQQLQYADVLPLFQMIAKNVGIRRARGRFVVATNIDIIFSPELVDFIASGRLQPGFLYRVDRHDIEPAFPLDASLEAQMAYCVSHQLRVHQRGGTQIVDRSGRIASVDDVVSAPVVSLGDGWYSREGDSQFGYVRWATDEARLLVDRSAATGLSRDAVLVLDVEPNAYQSGSWVEIEVLDGGRLLARRRLRQRTRFGVPLADDVDRHEIALKVVDISEGGRKALPLFERRDGLRYRLRAAGVSIVPQLSTRLSEFDPGSWGRANESRGLSVDRIREGVEVTIQGPNSAYCVRQGPFQVKAAGRHYFVLEYSSLEGGLDFSVLDNSYDRWCPSETLEIQQDDRRTVVLSCELVSGQSISLYVSNHLAPGETASRFILRRLRSSAAPRELTPTPSLYALIHAARGRVHNMLRTWRTRVNRGLNHVITLTRRVRTRLGGTETESREVVDLRAQLAESAAFNELAGLGRFLKEHRPSHLHQNGCGDFQLMAREHWFTLRGYPEFTMFSMNIDGLFSSAAHSAGIQERMLDMPRCIYHLEHERGSGWTPEGEAALRSRIAESGVGWLENETVHIMSAYMEWLGRPMIFNDLTWGFGETVLAEATFMPAGID